MSVPTGATTTDRELYRWQLDALVSWLRCGRRGVIEAVTGSGKTDVAIAAASDALRRGRFVLVVVPSRVLMEQWHGRLTEALGPSSALLLVAIDGEWTRRRVPSVEWAHDFANGEGIPSYDAAVVGYPERMREYNRRSKSKPAE